MAPSVEPSSAPEVDPCLCYAMLQMTCYGVLAAIVMRLKLFWTPQLCVMASLLASQKVFYHFILKSSKQQRHHCAFFFVQLMAPLLRERRWQVSLVVALLAVSSYQGIANIKEQRSIMGKKKLYFCCI